MYNMSWFAFFQCTYLCFVFSWAVVAIGILYYQYILSLIRMTDWVLFFFFYSCIRDKLNSYHLSPLFWLFASISALTWALLPNISISFQFNNINYKIIWWKECLLTDEWVLSVVSMSLVLTKIRTRMRNHTNRCVYFNYLWMHHNTAAGHWLAATDTLVPCPSSPWNTFFCFPSTGFCFHFANESKMQMAGNQFSIRISLAFT